MAVELSNLRVVDDDYPSGCLTVLLALAGLALAAYGIACFFSWLIRRSMW